jgi:hypothetical protein
MSSVPTAEQPPASGVELCELQQTRSLGAPFTETTETRNTSNVRTKSGYGLPVNRSHIGLLAARWDVVRREPLRFEMGT